MDANLVYEISVLISNKQEQAAAALQLYKTLEAEIATLQRTRLSIMGIPPPAPIYGGSGFAMSSSMSGPIYGDSGKKL